MPIAGMYSVVKTKFVGTGAVQQVASNNPRRVVITIGADNPSGVLYIIPGSQPTDQTDMWGNMMLDVHEWTYHKHGDMVLVEWWIWAMLGLNVMVVEVLENAQTCPKFEIGE